MGGYMPNTSSDREKMLDFLGLSSEEDLFAAVPEEVRINGLNLPSGMSEMEVQEQMQRLAEKNHRYRSCFLGAGSYRHYIPAIVKEVTQKEEFVTAYTPYQAEISQGILQSIFEYQTQICELTGMEVSNASVYDGATAAAEAVLMCEDKKHTGVLVAQTIRPENLAVIETYCKSRGVFVRMIPEKDGRIEAEALKEQLKNPAASVYVESPNRYGILEEMDQIVSLAHGASAKAIMGFSPIALGILRTPGEYGADIAVAEGQPLGLPMGFGGPYLGIMACKKELMRKLPGRMVGETKDENGERAFVLTLQAREQHIRREKATSNICSNEALCAMTASVYLAALGPSGLKRVAENCTAHAHYLAEKLAEIPGFSLRYPEQPFFHEFVTECPVKPDVLLEKLSEHDILGGLPVQGGILWCCTECNSRADIDELISVIKEVQEG